jgi:ribosomal protein S18 acetylase RimI-like enzyme
MHQRDEPDGKNYAVLRKGCTSVKDLRPSGYPQSLEQLTMDKNISLRKAEIGDIEQIKAILFSSLKEYEIALPDNYSISDIDSIADRNNNEQVFVLVRGDSVIGFVVLRPMTVDCIELKRLYLTSSERGRSFGKYLLNYAINFAQSKNYKYIRLETTSKFKEAVCLYKRNGFLELKEAQKAPGHDLAFEKYLKF